MPKKPKRKSAYDANRPLQCVTRKSITWRIPFDVLDRIDRLRKSQVTKCRTDVVVTALDEYLTRQGV